MGSAAERAIRSASLRYVSDDGPGIRRHPDADGFRYLSPSGKTITKEPVLRRIRALAIPPAWTDVWICGDRRGHIQACGRDARRRKQYRYHDAWRSARDAEKYGRLRAFGLALPVIRERVAGDLARLGLPRERVLAIILRLLESTLIRVGNSEYAVANRSYGLTTLRNTHVNIEGSELQFRFRGKSGQMHRIGLRDARLARLVRRCQELPGQDLFQYLDPSGDPHAIGSTDVNAYLAQISGRKFTAKDFRTWGGSVMALTVLREMEPVSSEAQAKRVIAEAMRAVAKELGNTPAVCRKCYVHPAVLDAYRQSALPPAREPAEGSRSAGLSADEAALITLLRRRRKA